VLGGDFPQALGRVEREGLIQRTMEANPALVDEKINEALELELENVYSNEDFGRNYIEPYFIEDSEIPEMAANSGKTVDEFKDLMEDADYYSQNEDGSVSFFAENKKIKNTKLRDAALGKEILTHKYGGEDGLNKHLEIEAYDYFSDYYVTDPPGFYAEFGGAPPGSLSEGNTTHATYFPRGGDNYTEKLFQYRDPTGRIPIDMVAESSHFGDSNYGTIFHTRQADYPVEGGGTARYIGEIQSDPQQKVGDRTSKTYEQSLATRDLEILKVKLRGLSEKDTLIKADMFSNMDEFDRNRLGYEASIYELNQYIKLRPIAGDSRWRALNMDKYKGITEIPLSGEMTDLQEELVNNFIRMSPFRGKNWSGDSEAQSIVSKYLLSNPVDWLPNNFRNEFSNVTADGMERALDIGEIKSEIIKKRSATYNDTGRYQGKGGPLMSSQNKWVDQALNQSILDAVNDPNIDYLAFPNDPDAIAKVGGLDVADVKEGTINYYQRDVQNRLKKLLKSFDKNINVSEIDMGTKEFGDFTANGIKITPEFRATVRKKGVPTMAAPFVGYGALDAISEDETMGGAI